MCRRWSLPCPMWIGVRFVPWLGLLARNGFRISPTRVPRAAAITCASIANEALRGITLTIWGRGLRAARLEADPVLILGHWRSGTTLLHELLACDRRFTPPNTLQCGAPSHFVLSEQFARDWLGFLLPPRRPMDAIPMGFERPQEDEVALCNLGLPSPWWGIAFPNEPDLDAAWADLEQLTDRDRDRWLAAWTGFLRDVQFEHPGRLLLKNPLHTHRVPLIRQVFPAADFIHIARDPHDLVPSCVHFWLRMTESHGLQRPRREGLEERVFTSIERMEARLAATWETIPPAHRFRTRYEDLVADPLAVLREIYAHFGWPARAAEPAWQDAVAAREDYRANTHPRDADRDARIASRLAAVLTRYGYPSRSAPSGAPQTPPDSSRHTQSRIPA
jgi:omega-hydroxy-beta-dihydromenaquinone-9 sulfotransferase